MEGWAKISGCLWMIGLCVMGLNWVTLFGGEPPPRHGLLGFFRLPILWAAFFVRACEIACAEQKFADDFAADKFEMLLEQLNPRFLAARVVGI